MMMSARQSSPSAILRRYTGPVSGSQSSSRASVKSPNPAAWKAPSSSSHRSICAYKIPASSPSSPVPLGGQRRSPWLGPGQRSGRGPARRIVGVAAPATRDRKEGPRMTTVEVEINAALNAIAVALDIGADGVPSRRCGVDRRE